MIHPPIHRYDSVRSTHEVLRDSFGDAEHLTTVVADHQSTGRGRSGRTWSTLPEHALLSATFLRVEPHALTWVTALAGIALRDAPTCATH